MQQNLRKIGDKYEKIAGEYLQNKGYEIIEYNFRCRYSEIDIIAKDKEYIVFCEVKFRNGKENQLPFEAVHKEKQRRISKAALYYLGTHDCINHACRFDVIGITGSGIIHIENAFEYVGV